MTIMNLISGQLQFGGIVFGRGTTVPVETVDEKPYDLNSQDFQLGRNDEMEFIQDQLKPTTIEITFDVRYNWLLPKYADLIPNFWSEMPTVDDFAREWKSDEIRQIAGQVKPLYICGRDGITKVVYGRPGQFTHAENTDYTEAVQCIAEFRRMDTFAYSRVENVAILDQSHLGVTLNGTVGNGPSWLRLLIQGPIVHPVFTLTNIYLRGDVELDFDYSVAAGEVVEISSYPWQRRVVNSEDPPINLAKKLIGDSPYLDRMRFGHDQQCNVSVAATGMTADTKIGVGYHDAYQVAK